MLVINCKNMLFNVGPHPLVLKVTSLSVSKIADYIFLFIIPPRRALKTIVCHQRAEIRGKGYCFTN